MSLFPKLELENLVQKDDSTRFSATKSYAAKDETVAIATVTITPGRDGSPISVFNADSDNWYLDWDFGTVNMDIDVGNNLLHFSEDGTTILVATLSSNTYTEAALATEMKTQLDVAGAFTYTVTYDANTDKFTVSATSSFDILPRVDNIWSILGFNDRYEQSLTSGSSYVGIRLRELMKKVTVTINNATTAISTSKYIGVLSSRRDQLFSSDEMLTQSEADLLKWVPPGRKSFLNMHREAQTNILAWLDEKGYVNVYSDKFILDDLQKLEEFRQWSKYMCLRLIFSGIGNAIDDIFAQKTKDYAILEEQARGRAVLRVDINRDGITDVQEDILVSVARVIMG